MTKTQYIRNIACSELSIWNTVVLVMGMIISTVANKFIAAITQPVSAQTNMNGNMTVPDGIGKIHLKAADELLMEGDTKKQTRTDSLNVLNISSIKIGV
jgi:hypothetical protein